jgi:hypothetical protein
MDRTDLDDLLSRVKEMEELLHFPTVQGHIERASTLAVSIARNAPTGGVANLAMQVMSAAIELRRQGGTAKPEDERMGRTLERLRSALQDAKKDVH